MKIVAAATHDALARQGVTAGPVVAMLAVLTLAVILTILAVAYLMYLKDRR